MTVLEHENYGLGELSGTAGAHQSLQIHFKDCVKERTVEWESWVLIVALPLTSYINPGHDNS